MDSSLRKKRGRLSSTPLNTRAKYSGIHIFEPDPLVKASHPLETKTLPSSTTDKGKAVLVDEVNNQEEPTIGELILEGIPVVRVTYGSFPLLSHELFPPFTSSSLFSSTLEATHV